MPEPGQCPAATDDPVGGDEVGDLPAGHRWGDQPGRGRAQVAHRRVDCDRDQAHGQGRRPSGVGTQAGSSWRATGLAARGRPGGDRAVDRGGQGAGHRAGGCAGKIRLGLSGPVPARVPAEVKEAVPKSVDDAVAAGLAHGWACALWQVSDCRVHRWRARRPNARIASWPIAAPTSSWCGCRRRLPSGARRARAHPAPATAP